MRIALPSFTVSILILNSPKHSIGTIAVCQSLNIISNYQNQWGMKSVLLPPIAACQSLNTISNYQNQWSTFSTLKGSKSNTVVRFCKTTCFGQYIFPIYVISIKITIKIPSLQFQSNFLLLRELAFQRIFCYISSIFC